MDYLQFISLNIILISFPIMLYFIYSCYTTLKGQKNSQILLGFSLVTASYLSLKFGNVNFDNKVLLFCNIPIIVAYLKKEYKIAVFVSITIILYCSFYLKIDIVVMIIKFISYLITYILIEKKLKHFDKLLLLKILAILQGFFVSFEYFYKKTNILDITNIYLLVLLFYIITFAIIYSLDLIDQITSLYSDIKNLENDKKVKESLFKITHEIKNPIAVCKGYLDMLDINSKSKLDKYIPIIKQEIDRCLNIMNDFMEFSKIKLEKDIIDLNLLLDDFYDSFKILIKNSNIKLIYKESNQEMYVLGDYNRLKQVMLNIIKNSVEAIKEKGNIKINTYNDTKNYYIEIIDNGIGMTQEELKKITEIFYTTKVKGSGIGVSLSNEIIKAHNGELIYKSIKNKGTTVTIKLPKYDY